MKWIWVQLADKLVQRAQPVQSSYPVWHTYFLLPPSIHLFLYLLTPMPDCCKSLQTSKECSCVQAGREEETSLPACLPASWSSHYLCFDQAIMEDCVAKGINGRGILSCSGQRELILIRPHQLIHAVCNVCCWEKLISLSDYARFEDAIIH